VALAVGAVAAFAGCSSPAPVSARAGTILAVGAENQYANVISQVGGRYVTATAIMSNPNTDPHTFEASARVASEVSEAELVVQNGLGYDTFMNKVEAAAPNVERRVVDVQSLLHLPASTPNPHLWYGPRTMPAVAGAVAADLSALMPSRAAYFERRVRAFDAALRPWYRAIARFAAAHRDVPVATTEPVGDDLLQALGADDLTPFGLQSDIMNGVDPSPEDVAIEDRLFRDHRVKVLVYNEQVTDALTQSFLSAARAAGVPVVGVYETMPEPGYDYQSWMTAETAALQRAVVAGTSTRKL
jgi:zinc/manganese transport system substrate-binding protein